MIDIELDIQPVIDNLARFNEQVTAETILISLAQKTKDSIFLRTMRNQDIKGGSFKSYGDKYAEKKGVGKSEVNLYSQKFGKHMMDDMAVRMLSNDSSEVYFQNKEKANLAYMHNTGNLRGNKKREFFGVTESDFRNLILSYSDYIKNVIQERKLA